MDSCGLNELNDARIMDYKRVFCIKTNQNNEIVKYIARLERITTLRALFAIINYRNMKQTNVKSTFLHGTIEEIK